MSALQWLRVVVGGAARRLHLEAQPAGPSGRSVEAALRVLGPGSGVRTAIDVGASDGRWSAAAAPHLPGARFLLVEAQAVHEARLRALCARDSRFEYVLAAAGPRRGVVHFDAGDPFGGVATETAPAVGSIATPMVAVDDEVAARRLPGPFLLKLDTHGFEVPILEGATEVLRQTALLVVEAYNFQLGPGALRFHELLAWLDARGFRCIDLVDFLYRPGDGVLWQMDLVLCPATSPLFRSDRYR